MKGNHNEKALQRIETLMGIGQGDGTTTLYYVQEELGDLHPAPRRVKVMLDGTLPVVPGSTPATAAHLANFEKSEAARIRRLKKKP